MEHGKKEQYQPNGMKVLTVRVGEFMIYMSLRSIANEIILYLL